MGWVAKQFPLAGGINEEDAQFTLKPGNLVFSRNYECLSGGGYKRIAGYERYDSSDSPSSTSLYKSFAYITGVSEPLDGEAVVGATSAATAKVAGLSFVDSGTWAGGNAAGHLALCQITGTFQNGEILKRVAGAVPLCTLDSTATTMSTDDEGYKFWIAGARNADRANIIAVPGFGPVLGIFVFGGYVYAWRATEADHGVQDLYKATGGSWSKVTLTSHLRYSTGTEEIFEGETITGATSAATAVVRRISIAAGSFAGPTYASGRFAITGITGTFQNGENLQVGGVTKAVAVGTQVATSMSVTTDVTRHRISINNFYGASNLRRVYGVDATNRGYEFDGTYFINIETAMTTDVPVYMAIHRNHLFYGFPGGSLQNSGTGLPLTWSIRTGAAEIGTGDDITGILSNGNNTLAITGDKTVHILTGTSNQDWNLRVIADEVGSIADSATGVAGQTMFVDRSGINVLLPAPPTFQDYSTQNISRSIRKTIQRDCENIVDVMFTTLKSQYRIYFNDKTAIVGTFLGDKLMGWMFMKYAHQFTCSAEGTDTAGDTRIFAGTYTGFVMELDVGTSFDGTEIDSMLQLPFQYHGYPDRDKRFHKLTLEVETTLPVRLYYGMDFDYGNSGQPLRLVSRVGRTTSAADYALFGELSWNSSSLAMPEVNIAGIARSAGIAIYHESDVDDVFTVSAILLQFTPLGIKR